MKKFLSVFAIIVLLFPSFAFTENLSAREAFIDDILLEAKALYDAAAGRLQSAHYSGDKYLCKNFTVYVFTKAKNKYRIAEYPDIELVIPNNLPKEESKPYYYGIEWENIPASSGNPFLAAFQFKYDKDLSKKENKKLAREFMKNVKKGDYFQMSADYYYGKGAHSLIFTKDYDAESDSVFWTDSNMRGEKRKGIRYGLPQYDAEKKIDWFVDAFCHKSRGATIYRLREDIIFK